MNIQQIQYVISVHELKSFGRAAEKCFVTQSTLSTMISRFEDEVGVTIFDRNTKPIKTTEEGEIVIEQLSIIRKELQNLDEVISELKGEVSGQLKVGVIPTVAPYLLPIFVDDFTKKHPSVKLIVSEISTQLIIDKLIMRELDLGILSTPIHHPNIVEYPIFNEPFMFYDAKGQINKSVITPTDINYERLWLLDEGHCMRKQVQTICNLKKNHLNSNTLRYQTGTIDTLMRLVNKNNGSTLLPLLGTLEFNAEQKKNLHSFAEPVPVRQIGVVTHKFFVKRKVLDSLIKSILNYVAPHLNELNIKEKIFNPL